MNEFERDYADRLRKYDLGRKDFEEVGRFFVGIRNAAIAAFVIWTVVAVILWKVTR